MIQAVIFDLDGTILDNESEWEEAFRLTAKNFQLPITNFQLGGWMHEPGIGLVPNWKKLTGDFQKAEMLAGETVKKYKEISGRVSVRDGVEELVVVVKDKGLLTALATSSVWTVVEKELEELGLILAFDITTTGEEVLAMKPDPEIYILTAQKLEVDPRDCVVIEDSISGVLAGVDAGMLVVGLESEYVSKQKLDQAGAKWVVQEMAQIKEILENLLVIPDTSDLVA